MTMVPAAYRGPRKCRLVPDTSVEPLGCLLSWATLAKERPPTRAGSCNPRQLIALLQATHGS